MEIEICNLKKSYGKHMVLDIDSLKLHKQSITAIVGANGAGKSTLFSIIAGLMEADEGCVLYDQSADVPYSKLTLVFQEPYLLHTSVKENIAYPLKIRGYDKAFIQQRVEELARELGISRLLTKKADQLSLGEIQKVALARALSFHPDLLLLDEPSANLDPHTTLEIETMLSKMKDTTILMITHNLAQAKRVADHVILLHCGKVIEALDAETFFNCPRRSETKKFIEGELLI